MKATVNAYSGAFLVNYTSIIRTSCTVLYRIAKEFESCLSDFVCTPGEHVRDPCFFVLHSTVLYDMSFVAPRFYAPSLHG